MFPIDVNSADGEEICCAAMFEAKHLFLQGKDCSSDEDESKPIDHLNDHWRVRTKNKNPFSTFNSMDRCWGLLRGEKIVERNPASIGFGCRWIDIRWNWWWFSSRWFSDENRLLSRNSCICCARRVEEFFSTRNQTRQRETIEFFSLLMEKKREREMTKKMPSSHFVFTLQIVESN